MIFIKIGTLIIALIFGYLMASFPTGVVVSKLFFHKDIRQYGSGNPGATNAGRVFGKKAFLMVVFGDVFKTVVPIWAVTLIIWKFNLYDYTWIPWVSYITALGCTMGHCYPIFANFKGGKAVSTFGAFVFTTNWVIALSGIAVLIIVVLIKKYVSLGSMIASAFCVVASLLLLMPGFERIGMYPLMESGIIYSMFLIVQAGFLYWRHRTNIIRLLNHQETKVKWIK
ncbi:MAG TPA: acyl-phosphate glycerol 3-phosphate acyltransferase [Firmicutes bacterium]|jgi:glycerol-3-phosphate acyltransferase PlsY|nr:acyl-phosphate glycerol 3-phosphate acyltransferase [Bacillota bacterium]HAV19873.1 acyl-phosphate glycerol 3-phosphate acyltransferase [Bacillota bacterium]